MAAIPFVTLGLLGAANELLFHVPEGIGGLLGALFLLSLYLPPQLIAVLFVYSIVRRFQDKRAAYALCSAIGCGATLLLLLAIPPGDGKGFHLSIVTSVSLTALALHALYSSRRPPASAGAGDRRSARQRP
ncbi:MAG: hypothetical protein E6G94_03610 [Alphaproteobacteria bacterium]|nr:MAG: hypothetical protein E6G94_03610 [Alphaproteobacteria bacterium]